MTKSPGASRGFFARCDLVEATASGRASRRVEHKRSGTHESCAQRGVVETPKRGAVGIECSGAHPIRPFPFVRDNANTTSRCSGCHRSGEEKWIRRRTWRVAATQHRRTYPMLRRGLIEPRNSHTLRRRVRGHRSLGSDWNARSVRQIPNKLKHRRRQRARTGLRHRDPRYRASASVPMRPPEPSAMTTD